MPRFLNQSLRPFTTVSVSVRLCHWQCDSDSGLDSCLGVHWSICLFADWSQFQPGGWMGHGRGQLTKGGYFAL